LHCHTEYSLLDGAIRIKDLCSRAKDYGLPAVAITDHGNMYGAVTFYMAAKDVGLKPIIGCEAYVAPKGMDDRSARSASEAGHHLVLLAKDIHGYRNLIKLVSSGYLQGFHYKPRVDKELLRRHSEGLIALSACLGGGVSQALLKQGLEAGVEEAREYADIFPGSFYLELQENGLPEQARVNEMMLDVARKTELPLAATNDCHYLDQEDYEAHDILLCIQTASCVDQKKRMRMDTQELYFKPPELMERQFSYAPQAVENTFAIAERCNLEIELGKNHFPVYELPEGVSIDDEFRRLSEEGLRKRLEIMDLDEEREQAYWDRLGYEMGVIQEMGFPAYFLIVQDFINWAKNQGIPVGPGRGSAAGSLVAYALRITNLDPLPYNLLFERFLNVERVSMPDIDVDFCERRRVEVIRYVSEKYGEDSVAQITTFGTMKAKAVVRDVGRALGMSFAETDKIAKLIPEDLKMTIDKALEQEPELENLAFANATVAKLLDISKRLEGLCRHASTHAAGVVISDKPMTEYLPLYRGKKGEVVTQYDMKKVEKVGLIKFDFLGLRTMTVIQDCLRLIGEQGKPVPDLDAIGLDDPKAYEVFAAGDTDGIFQVESSGMRKYLRMLKPGCFEDVIAMLALYRPGPLESGMVEDFIQRKQGLKEVSYPHPLLEDTLKATYGVIVYQEQVMRIAQVMANYSLGEGDLLRRAMGKKVAAEMAAQRQRFLEGARENDIPESKANEVFDLMELFAKYGFNKSHSAAYALISYYTAFLKAHYPVEFMAALISSELSNQDKVFKYLNACREMGVELELPNVNLSQRDFSIRGGKIIFGLGGVKNVGDEAIREIIREREANGDYRDLVDFCSRVNLRKVTKRVIEYLIKSGSMDCLAMTRAGLFAGLDKAVSFGQKRAREKASGQLSMLDMLGGDGAGMPAGVDLMREERELEEWPDDEKLKLEKEALGFFLSSHPLLAYRREIGRMQLTPLDECKEYNKGAQVKVGVIVTGVKEHMTKRGEKMAFCQVEDLSGPGEMTMFADVYQAAKPHIAEDAPLLVEAKVDAREQNNGEEGPRQTKLLAEEVSLLADARENADAPVLLELDLAAGDGLQELLSELKGILARHPGRAPVSLQVALPGCLCTLRLADSYKILTGPEFWKELDAWQALARGTRGEQAA
ncbi:MAG: DNA polymerase III subunit alpha, partial [Desulfovibrionaceae bacterium]